MIGPTGDNTAVAIAIVGGACFSALGIFMLGFAGYVIGGVLGVAFALAAIAVFGAGVHAVTRYLDGLQG